MFRRSESRSVQSFATFAFTTTLEPDSRAVRLSPPKKKPKPPEAVQPKLSMAGNHNPTGYLGLFIVPVVPCCILASIPF